MSWRASSRPSATSLRVSGDSIGGLGWTTRIRASDDLGEKLEVSRIELLAAPVSLSDVTSRLDSRHLAHYVTEGQQSEQTGKALVNALRQARLDDRSPG